MSDDDDDDDDDAKSLHKPHSSGWAKNENQNVMLKSEKNDFFFKVSPMPVCFCN